MLRGTVKVTRRDIRLISGFKKLPKLFHIGLYSQTIPEDRSFELL